MSNITFIAAKKEAVVRGSERAYARHIVYSQAIKLLVDLATSGVEEISIATRERVLGQSDYVSEAWDAFYAGSIGGDGAPSAVESAAGTAAEAPQGEMTEYERVARERAIVEPVELGSEIEIPKFVERERLCHEYA